jgi:hypothetical protein
MEPERLGGKQHFIYANETAIPKTVQCVRIVKSRVGVMKLCIIAQHTPANLDLVPEIVLNYSTRRWTSSAKIKERIYRSRLSRLETKNYSPFFSIQVFKLMEIVGYLILTRGRANPLIKYDRKRIRITHLSQTLWYNFTFFSTGYCHLAGYSSKECTYVFSIIVVYHCWIL